MLLSASPVINRVPDRSNVEQKMPASLSSDPGCTCVAVVWKLYPLFQSYTRTISKLIKTITKQGA